jgi:hypothetical protein
VAEEVEPEEVVQLLELEAAAVVAVATQVLLTTLPASVR